jgi:hypothetical protein
MRLWRSQAGIHRIGFSGRSGLSFTSAWQLQHGWCGGEATGPEQIKAVRHRNIPTISEEEGKYLVNFHIEGVRPLIGNE